MCFFDQKKISNRIPFAVKLVLLFGIEFSVKICRAISLRKIAFLVLLFCFLSIYCRGKKIRLHKSWVYVFVSLLLLFIYVIFIRIINFETISILENESYPINRPIILLLNILIFPFFLALIFKDEKEFCAAQADLMLFQSLIIFLEKLNHEFALYIYHHFYYYDDGRMLDGLMRGVRFPGIDMGGATASVILFSGCFCCLYLVRLGKRKVEYMCKCMIILLSMIYVGRTGLYFSFLLLGIFFLEQLWRSTKISIALLIIGVLAGVGVSLYILYAPDSLMKAHYMTWVGEIFTKGIGEGSTIQILSDMEIPPVSKETILGMGIVRGTSCLGTVVQHDSGYIMNYAALGILGALFLYLTICLFYISQIKEKSKPIRIFLFLFLLFILIFEIKEPFSQKTPLLIILSLLVFLAPSYCIQLREKGIRSK